MGLKRALGQLATANILFAVLSFVTSPIAAHALGPVGRGRLAAVTVPFFWANVLFQFGLPAYAQRAIARGDAETRGRIIATLALLALCIGAAGLFAGPPVARLLAPHDELVRRYIKIGFLILPLTLAGEVCIGVATGEARWRWLMAIQLSPQVILLLAYLSLVVLDGFTVESAILAAYGAAALTSVIAIRSVGRVKAPRFAEAIVREAASFSPRAWIGTFANYANARLDQLLMVPLVPARQLGLYAVAVTITVLDGLVLSAMPIVVGPSIARGEHDLVGRSVRLTIAVDLCFCIAVAAVLPVALPLVFGARFSGAVPMCYVLLLGSVPGTAAAVLGQALQNAGRPGVPALGEALALAVTVVGLVLLLPPLEGIGAAIVSDVAYAVSFSVQVALARKHLHCSLRDLTVPRRSDWSSLRALAVGRLRQRG